MNKRAVLYARVALANSCQLQSQIDACRAYAEERGFKVMGEFPDDGVSGNLPLSDRPQGRVMIEALKRLEAPVVIVTTADRLSRNPAQVWSLVQQWQEVGIELHYVRGM